MPQQQPHRPRAGQLQPPQNLPHHRRRRRQRVDKERGRLQQAAGQRHSPSTGGSQLSVAEPESNREPFTHFTLPGAVELLIFEMIILNFVHGEIKSKLNQTNAKCGY